MNEPDLSVAPAPRSLYVHVPFCVHRCHYCDFSVARTAEAPIVDWIGAIEADFESWFRSTGWERGSDLETVFVGGGTPSLLGSHGMSELRSLLSEYFNLAAVREWTAEANPASLTGEICEAWLEAGVNRLSLGVQSFDDEPLAWLGRLHDADGAVEALGTARFAGFSNVNVDLIFGLPASVDRDWATEVDRVLELGVTHVSVYGLTAESGTPLGRRVTLGRVHMPPDDRYEAEYLAVVRLLTEAGFGHYEVSNFALEGRECVHNWHYWDGTPYLGVGPSAHSFLPPHRIWNVYRWEAYRVAARDGVSVREGFESLDREQVRMERAWLDLRTRTGLSAGALVSGPASIENALARYESAGWLQNDAGRIRLTAAGWLRMDALIAELETG